jgi:hypothetical protein
VRKLAKPDALISENQGWTYLELEGSAFERGYQHGKFLGRLIPDSINRVKLWAAHALGRDWNYFRDVAQKFYEPKASAECAEELKGILAGSKEVGVTLDYSDLVALNGYEDSMNYHYFLRKQEKAESQAVRVGGCSAFVAVGSMTGDLGIVMGHNTWWPYLLASNWNIILHVKPTRGYEILMQSIPGFIYSGTDWYMNSSGLLVCETTITGMYTFRPEGTPTFVRVREAMQYAADIDSWSSMMLKDNNGGLANSWLIGDTNRNEIARLELGTFNHQLQRTNDGWFVGCNLALDDRVRSETDFDYSSASTSPTARHRRWSQLSNPTNKLDINIAKSYLADHYDASIDRELASRCSLCGHVDTDERGCPEFEWGPFYPGGSFDAKITTTSLAKEGKMWARWGKPCGTSFESEPFLKKHPEYSWQKPLLNDLKSYDWTLIEGGFGSTSANRS